MNKPIVSIHTKFDDFQINLDFYDKVTFIAGESGIGKSYLYEQLSLLATETEFSYIKCFNYLSPDFETQVKNISNDAANLIIIDNFETLCSKDLAAIILTSLARFVLISRDFFGLMQSKFGVAELCVEDNRIKLSYPLADEGA